MKTPKPDNTSSDMKVNVSPNGEIEFIGNHPLEELSQQDVDSQYHDLQREIQHRQ